MPVFKNTIRIAIAILRAKGEVEIAQELEERCFPSVGCVLGIKVDTDLDNCGRCGLPQEGGVCKLFGKLRDWDEINGHHRLPECKEAALK